jgi:hypothetical protein
MIFALSVSFFIPAKPILVPGAYFFGFFKNPSRASVDQPPSRLAKTAE